MGDAEFRCDSTTPKPFHYLSPDYVTNEAELKTWRFNVGPDGTLSEPKLFATEGGESVAVDDRGNVYIAATHPLLPEKAVS